MNYQPGPVAKLDLAYLARELVKISDALRDNAPTVFYRGSYETELSASAGDSANYKIGLSANITRISTSNTATITGIADSTPNRERVLINVGTGVLVLKSEGTESSAQYRLALSETLWNLSANASAVLWYDPASSRHRGISRT